jgi:amphi-Trp domain-containing protein
VEILKVERKETLSREDAAARLRAIADGLARHNDVELELEGTRVRLDVADQVQLEVEVEVGEQETELEIELTWRR